MTPTSRDPARSLFGIALALTVAAILLREVHDVRLVYDALAVVWFASLFATAVSVVASLVDAAKSRRVRPLYFAVILLAGQVFGFAEEMDGDVVSLGAAFLWALLATLLFVEASSLMRPAKPAEDPDLS